MLWVRQQRRGRQPRGTPFGGSHPDRGAQPEQQRRTRAVKTARPRWVRGRRVRGRRDRIPTEPARHRRRSSGSRIKGSLSGLDRGAGSSSVAKSETSSDADSGAKFGVQAGVDCARVLRSRPGSLTALMFSSARIRSRSPQGRELCRRDVAGVCRLPAVGAAQRDAADLAAAWWQERTGGPGCPASKDDLLHAVSRSKSCQASVTWGARRIRHPRNWRARRARRVARPSASGAGTRVASSTACTGWSTRTGRC